MVDDRELVPGERYGAYEVIEVLGRGAFAAVYRVHAPGFPQGAALKLSLRPVGDTDAARRALREIAVLRTLTNNHVVRVHAAGQGEDGRVFILMDYLEGQQLDEFHDFDEPMPAAQATWMVHQACLGLAEAHAHGIVHRDVKPANLWVEPDHNVRVIDFGLARAGHLRHHRQARSPSAACSSARRTTASPSSCTATSSRPRATSTASRSCSTSCSAAVACSSPTSPSRPCAIAARRPGAVAGAHRSTPPTPLHRYKHLAELPVALGELVLQCLEKMPELRPANAGVLANSLGSILHYDFGVAVAAMLRITLPWGGHDEALLLPGSHRIGAGKDVEILLRATGVRPVRSSSGAGRRSRRSRGRCSGTARCAERPAAAAARTAARGDRIEIGPFAIDLEFPS
ncbi:MAG: serine/threonine-protein kinase [Nannocystaceae bacterium]